MLLHDVFDYTHSEIGAMLGKREEAVRQMVLRARVRVRQDRPRILIDHRKAEDLTERFLSALHDGNVDCLRAILATDVVAMADGGGKAYAGLRPVIGIDKVSRMMVGLHDKFWAAARAHRLMVNGLPGSRCFKTIRVHRGCVRFRWRTHLVDLSLAQSRQTHSRWKRIGKPVKSVTVFAVRAWADRRTRMPPSQWEPPLRLRAFASSTEAVLLV